MQCPKCDYVRQTTDTEREDTCPKCGIVYAKFRPREISKPEKAVSPSLSSNLPHTQKPDKLHQAVTIFGVAVFMTMLYEVSLDSLSDVRFFSEIYELLLSIPIVLTRHVEVLLMLVPAFALLLYINALKRLSNRNKWLFIVLGISASLYVVLPWIIDIRWGNRLMNNLIDTALRLSLLFSLIGILINLRPSLNAANSEGSL